MLIIIYNQVKQNLTAGSRFERKLADREEVKIGKTLRAAREHAGLTQDAVATKAGITRVYVAFLEADRQSPTLNVFEKVAEAVGVRPSTLLARAERSSGREKK